MNRKIGIYLIIQFMYFSNAYGHECSIYEDKSNKFEFGSAFLGQDSEKISGKLEKLDNCLLEEGKYLDCELRDTNNVHYIIVLDKIVMKEVVLSGERTSKEHVLGILGGSYLDDVLQKLKEEKNIVWGIVFLEDGDLGLSTDFCIKNSINQIYELYFIFDKDYQLKKFGSRLNAE